MDSERRASKQVIDISSIGRINGEEFNGHGTGTGDADIGGWDFEVTFSRVPRAASAFATLVAILILPTIIFAREGDDTENLLTLASGNVEFTQLTDGDGVAVQSHGSIRAERDGRMSWQSEATGDIRMGDIREVEPFDAIMLPMGPGKIADVLTFPFVTDQGRQLVHAVRNITFNPRSELPGVQFRRIQIEPNAVDATVTVSTRSTLRAPGARRLDAQ